MSGKLRRGAGIGLRLGEINTQNFLNKSIREMESRWRRNKESTAQPGALGELETEWWRGFKQGAWSQTA